LKNNLIQAVEYPIRSGGKKGRLMPFADEHSVNRWKHQNFYSGHKKGNCRNSSMKKGIVGLNQALVSATDNRLKLWQGDITRLSADAIVNAANSQMLGCFVSFTRLH